jgi:hypothetical protein
MKHQVTFSHATLDEYQSIHGISRLSFLHLYVPRFPGHDETSAFLAPWRSHGIGFATVTSLFVEIS